VRRSILLSALPLALRAPLFVGKWLRVLAFLAVAALVLAIVGFTPVTGEPRGWAKVLAVLLSLLFVAALVATFLVARRALRTLRSFARGDGVPRPRRGTP
jgi:hypothetical protein